LRKCSWSEEEDLKLIDLYEKHGNKFTIIGIALNRADIHVRNRIHSTKRMALKHQDGTSTLNTRKDGVLFKYFLARHRGTQFSPYAELQNNNNNNNNSWRPSTATMIKQEIAQPAPVPPPAPTAAQVTHATNLVGFHEMFVHGVQHQQQQQPKSAPSSSSSSSSSKYLPAGGDFNYAHNAPTPLITDESSGYFNPQPVTTSHQGDGNNLSGFLAPQAPYTADISVSSEYRPVEASDFLLTPTPKPLKSLRTSKFTPGSWSRDFSFWGGSSPRSSVSGLIGGDFAVPKPQEAESHNAGDPGLESFISSYANQPFCDLPEPSPTTATFSQMCF
jgi:hypothetical protein